MHLQFQAANDLSEKKKDQPIPNIGKLHTEAHHSALQLSTPEWPKLKSIK